MKKYAKLSSEIHKPTMFVINVNGAALIMNASLNATEPLFVPKLFYRHSMTMTTVYCVPYLLVFGVGLVDNFFVLDFVIRTSEERNVADYFILNLAVADILVIVKGSFFLNGWYSPLWVNKYIHSL